MIVLFLISRSRLNLWMLSRMQTRTGRVIWALPLLLNLLRGAAGYYLVHLLRR